MTTIAATIWGSERYLPTFHNAGTLVFTTLYHSFTPIRILVESENIPLGMRIPLFCTTTGEFFLLVLVTREWIRIRCRHKNEGSEGADEKDWLL
ncbi:uncharacterized protein B0I36DRAFT_340586 [Microdochium trichocladiopsis]|uniref:Transmembrane protein n=1 Tax=Microdochium trichocladiopsis TaxID=1682393 RepID=A0A9P8XQX1_9PEZI|nr:uncharacterized protein B0I36DRAFT_340586 [Microdochium trichocladiopsis]KAH7012161.1 hypothetical protein B0I36DRAFT_340586 [Microdochium trichocladiopsis]